MERNALINQQLFRFFGAGILGAYVPISLWSRWDLRIVSYFHCGLFVANTLLPHLLQNQPFVAGPNGCSLTVEILKQRYRIFAGNPGQIFERRHID